jgi:hypothetical protein
MHQFPFAAAVRQYRQLAGDLKWRKPAKHRGERRKGSPFQRKQSREDELIA